MRSDEESLTKYKNFKDILKVNRQFLKIKGFYLKKNL